jgi:hypothetical protein
MTIRERPMAQRSERASTLAYALIFSFFRGIFQSSGA